jgi:enoyl-CoA hydratase
VAIGISPPSFAIELARSRVHPAWLSRTVTLGELFEPEDAVIAGFLDRLSPADEVEERIDGVVAGLRALHAPSHTLAKQRLRRSVMAAMRDAIDSELTLRAYGSRSTARSAVVLPSANR